MPSRWLTVHEAARRLGLTRQGVYHRIASGLLGARKRQAWATEVDGRDVEGYLSGRIPAPRVGRKRKHPPQPARRQPAGKGEGRGDTRQPRPLTTSRGATGSVSYETMIGVSGEAVK